MKGFSLKYRLILPIALLGIVALISNILAVSSISNVNANAANIADNYMAGNTILADIRQSTMNIHKLALSHIVATDYNTMITVVVQIKEEEKVLDDMLAAYEGYVTPSDLETYQALLSNYESFKHALVYLVCASAGSKTQEAYAYANGDVAVFAAAIESNINDLNASISQQTAQARVQLSAVYIGSMIISSTSIVICIILVLITITIILRSVVKPIHNILSTIQGSSERMNDVVGEVLKRTQNSNKSATDLSAIAVELSSAIQAVANNASNINRHAEEIKSDVNDMADECNTITEYSVAMRTRADEMEQSAQTSLEETESKVADILEILNEAIEQSRSVDQVNSLTDEILGISAQTTLIAFNASLEAGRAGEAGKGFEVVAKEVRQLSDSSREIANRIQEVNEVVTSAVYNLSENAQNLVDFMNESILTEFQEFVHSGNQYKNDAAYIEQVMDNFNDKTSRLRSSMIEIVESIRTITNAIDDGASGITGVADSTRDLVEDMDDITKRMDINQEIVSELKKETTVFANL